MNRTLVGSPCPVCRTPSEGGLTYFDMSILSLVDLIQEAYTAIPPDSHPSSQSTIDSEMTHSVSVVVFYTTLREALLQRFTMELMFQNNLQLELRERLYKDYNSHNERLFKLFPALAGLDWDEALQLVNASSGKDFSPVSETMKDIAVIRNKFVHETNFFGIDRNIATRCIEFLYPTFELFVALHNVLIHSKKFPNPQPAP